MEPNNPFVNLQIAYKFLKDIKENRDAKTKKIREAEMKSIAKMELDIEIDQDEDYIVKNIGDKQLGYFIIKTMRDELGCQNYPSVQEKLDIHLESQYYDYELLGKIDLLRHSYNVAFEIIDILNMENVNPPYMKQLCIIAALFHDIGKNPLLAHYKQNKLDRHEKISARWTEDFLNKYIINLQKHTNFPLEAIDVVVYMIEKHHTVPSIYADPKDNKLFFWKLLKKADHTAREKEIRFLREKLC